MLTKHDTDTITDKISEKVRCCSTSAAAVCRIELCHGDNYASGTTGPKISTSDGPTEEHAFLFFPPISHVELVPLDGTGGALYFSDLRTDIFSDTSELPISYSTRATLYFRDIGLEDVGYNTSNGRRPGGREGGREGGRVSSSSPFPTQESACLPVFCFACVFALVLSYEIVFS